MRIINHGSHMKAMEEIVLNSPGLSFCFQEHDQPFSFSWHYHRGYEITYISEGRGRRFIGDDVSHFGQGDLALIGPYVPHAYASAPSPQGNRAFIIQFSTDLVAFERTRPQELRHVRKLLRLAENGVAFDPTASEALLPILDASRCHVGLEKLIDLIRILDLLAQSGRGRPVVSEWYRQDASSVDSGGAREHVDLLQFVFANACGPLTLKEAAEFADISVASLCRFFRKRVGSTFNEYLTRIRIGEACKLLIQTDLPVYSVSYQAGFENLSNFNRRFLRMKGMTPLVYRRLHRSRSTGLSRVRSASST